jgi:hypothetical protein
MRVIDHDPEQLHFEDRVVTQRGWLIWAALFLPGMLALLFLPEDPRFIGLLIWIVLWLASIALVPRLLGETIRVTVDSKARKIIWARSGQTARTVPFAEIKLFDTAKLVTASRPYRTFQLFALLKNGNRLTLAVDPNEATIQRAFELAQLRLR